MVRSFRRPSHRGIATNLERIAQTDASGYYFFAVLPVGTYDVTTEGAGFQPTKQIVTLETAQKGRPDFKLSVSQVQTAVTVDAGLQVSRYTEQGGATSAGRQGGFNVHGVSSLQNNFILDGVDNNTI